MSSGSSPGNSLATPAVAVLGADAILAALPATAVQLAHACLAAGYTAAFPASWGDELVAEGCVRHLVSRGPEPAIMCSCPLVADRLLGSELTPQLVPLVAPPVACARYLRAVYAPADLHITYIGSCPSASDPAIDAHLSPAEFLAQLAACGIAVDEQPLFFESVLPPDRRRFYSLPGGVPAPDWLAAGGAPRQLVELDAEDYRPQLAEHLLARAPVLLDLAPRLGCACSGAGGRTPASDARRAVAALEPPRSNSDVVDARVHVDIERPIPAAPDSVDESSIAGRTETHSDDALVARNGALQPHGIAREDSVAGAGPFAQNHRSRPAAARRTVRRSAAHAPVARAADGQVLPRAYLAHHRPRFERVLPMELADMAPAEIADQLFCEPATPAGSFRAWASLPRAVADPLTP